MTFLSNLKKTGVAALWGSVAAYGTAALDAGEAHAQLKAEVVESEPEGDPAANTAYLELLGPGFLYSLNYERLFPAADINLRIGVGGASWSGSGYLQVPIGFNYIGVGNRKHHLELGATANISYLFSNVADDLGEQSSAGFVTFSPIIGYRIQPHDGGFNFRTGLSPIIAGFGEGVVGAGFLPWPYVSFGGSF